jgi:hypothetical protein
MAVRDIPTTDIINANAATKLVIVTSLPHLAQSCHQEYHSQKAYYKVGNSNGCVLIAKNNNWQKYTDRALETIKYYNLVCFWFDLHNGSKRDTNNRYY